MPIDEVNALNSKTFPSHVNGDMTDTASGIEHASARREPKRMKKMIFHGSQRFVDRKRPVRIMMVESHVARAPEKETIANS
jgi:hypothetical protein